MFSVFCTIIFLLSDTLFCVHETCSVNFHLSYCHPTKDLCNIKQHWQSGARWSRGLISAPRPGGPGSKIAQSFSKSRKNRKIGRSKKGLRKVGDRKDRGETRWQYRRPVRSSTGKRKVRKMTSSRTWTEVDGLLLILSSRYKRLFLPYRDKGRLSDQISWNKL